MHEPLALGHFDRDAQPVEGLDQRLDIGFAEQGVLPLGRGLEQITRWCVSALCRSLHNALYAEAKIMPMLVSRSLFLAEIAGKGLA